MALHPIHPRGQVLRELQGRLARLCVHVRVCVCVCVCVRAWCARIYIYIYIY
jgi:hypothetical protein